MHIAVLDDEPDQSDLIRLAVEGLGHVCHCFSEGRGLLRALRHERFDLLVLDWALPDMSGPRVVKMIRENMLNQLPVLFVTNRREEADMVEGLGAGADDFMVKPIRVGELSARLQALLRRAYPNLREVELAYGPYQFHPYSRTVRLHGELLELKHREYELALFFFKNLGRSLTREYLRDSVWGPQYKVSSRSLDTHISRVRTKLDLRPRNGFLLSAIYGLGYRLEALDPEMPGMNWDTADAEA